MIAGHPLSRRNVLALLAAMGGVGAAASDTLTRMRNAGEVRVAIDLTMPPYAMLDAQLQPVGSEVDTARLLCADLGLTFRPVPVNSAARIPFLLTGKADLVISLMSVTPERSQVIGFSRPYGAILSVLAGPPTPPVADFAGLVGRRVAVTRGSTNDRWLSAGALPGTTVLRFADDADSMTAVAVGQADYYATAPGLLPAVNQRRPDRTIAPLFSLGRTLYAIGLPHGDTALKDWVDAWLDRNLRNGRLAEIYRRWHFAEMPPDLLTAASER